MILLYFLVLVVLAITPRREGLRCYIDAIAKNRTLYELEVGGQRDVILLVNDGDGKLVVCLESAYLAEVAVGSFVPIDLTERVSELWFSKR